VTDQSTARSVEPAHGLTPREVARYLRISRDRVLGWIRSGELGALNTADVRCGRPRYIVLPEHLAAFAATRRAGQPIKSAPRQRRVATVDYFPDV
jgi:excisionase family DNA binding protein